MRALDPEVIDAVWAACEPLIPMPVSDHPLGCHRRRIPNKVCFRGILIRLAVGCSWEDTERLLDHAVSDTTLRTRRDEWVAAGVFSDLEAEALAAYDRIVGLDLSEVSRGFNAGDLNPLLHAMATAADIGPLNSNLLLRPFTPKQ